MHVNLQLYPASFPDIQIMYSLLFSVGRAHSSRGFRPPHAFVSMCSKRESGAIICIYCQALALPTSTYTSTNYTVLADTSRYQQQHRYQQCCTSAFFVGASSFSGILQTLTSSSLSDHRALFRWCSSLCWLQLVKVFISVLSVPAVLVNFVLRCSHTFVTAIAQRLLCRRC